MVLQQKPSVWCSDLLLTVQSIEGELYIVGELAGYSEFNHHVKLFLFDVARHHKLPDFDLVLSTSDSCHQPGAFNGSSKKCPSLVSKADLKAKIVSFTKYRRNILFLLDFVRSRATKI